VQFRGNGIVVDVVVDEPDVIVVFVVSIVVVDDAVTDVDELVVVVVVVVSLRRVSSDAAPCPLLDRGAGTLTVARTAPATWEALDATAEEASQATVVPVPAKPPSL
jgi:hypothetical protein